MGWGKSGVCRAREGSPKPKPGAVQLFIFLQANLECLGNCSGEGEKRGIKFLKVGFTMGRGVRGPLSWGVLGRDLGNWGHHPGGCWGGSGRLEGVGEKSGELGGPPSWGSVEEGSGEVGGHHPGGVLGSGEGSGRLGGNHHPGGCWGEVWGAEGPPSWGILGRDLMGWGGHHPGVVLGRDLGEPPSWAVLGIWDVGGPPS